MVIKINVADKIAELTDKDAYIVCDNSDYVVQFTFDSAWDDYEAKTARFACGCGYIDVPFFGSECEVPILQHGKAVSIGVFAGSLVTTTAATVPLVKSIRSRGGEPLPPESAVYDRIIALIKQGGVEAETLYQIIARYLAENPYTETDPTVPSWAKADTKPTYTASEVGADASGTAASAVAAHNTSTAAHSDIRQLVTELTTSKVNVSDIIDNLATNVSSKPLSAAQGVALKALIDEIEGADAGLGITGASAGEAAVVSEVDTNGKPTKWTHGSMLPTAGGTMTGTLKLKSGGVLTNNPDLAFGDKFHIVTSTSTNDIGLAYSEDGTTWQSVSISGVKAPAVGDGVANKTYVDDAIDTAVNALPTGVTVLKWSCTQVFESQGLSVEYWQFNQSITTESLKLSYSKLEEIFTQRLLYSIEVEDPEVSAVISLRFDYWGASAFYGHYTHNNEIEYFKADSTGIHGIAAADIPRSALASDVQASLGKADSALQESDLQSAVNTALTQAKESGEFKGEKGDKGDTGATGATGAAGAKGDKGDDGTSVTVTSVSESTADGGSNVVTFSNGSTVTIKNGSKGSTGAKGDTGATGAQGEKGDKGDTGATGAAGAKGDKGDDGTSVTVTSVSESTADGGSNVVTFSNGSTVTIKNGSKGSTGAKGDTGATGAQGEKGDKGDTGATGAAGAKGEKGDKGDTPVKGTDYWTAADKEEMVDDVLAALSTWTGGSY